MTKRKISRRTFLRALLGGGLAAGLGLPLSRWYVAEVEPYWLTMARRTLCLPRLPRAFDGMTVAHLSDLHLGPVPSIEKSLRMVRAAIRAAVDRRPDLIAVTGDFVRRSGWEANLLEVLRPLSAAMGVFGVRGNHDWYCGVDRVTDLATQAGLHMLVNESTMLERGGEKLVIAGIDDLYDNHHDLERALAGVPEDAAVMLLAHEPDFADAAARDARLILQLSGHSHGGQVRLPFVGQAWLPRLGQKYPAGLYHVGGMQVYTNRGIGVVGVPVRFNCRPEVTLLTLRSA